MESFVSAEAVKPWVWCFKIGFWLKCLPFVWNEATGRVEQIEERRVYKILEACHLFRHVGMSLYILSMCRFSPGATGTDVILSVFMVCIFILVGTAHALFIGSHGTLELVINEILTLIQNSDLSKAPSRRGKTGPTILKMLACSGIGCNVMGYPATIIAVHQGYPMFRFFKFGSMHFPFTILWATGFIVDWALVVNMCFITILYTTVAVTSISKATSVWAQAAVDHLTREELHSYYRVRQVHHAIFENILRSRLLVILLAAIGLILTPLFCLIRFHSVFNPLVVGLTSTVGGFSLTILMIGMNIAVSLTTWSTRFAHGYFSRIRPGSKLDRTVHATYRRPLRFTTGVFEIGRLTFPIILQEVVINWIIDLLVFFN